MREIALQKKLVKQQADIRENSNEIGGIRGENIFHSARIINY
jgi:hypothetical protein